DGCDAIERIADIAFVLHEREVEASLCDALDAAVREVGAAGANFRSGAERAHEAMAQLNEIERRLEEMIGRSDVLPRAEKADVATEDISAKAVTSSAGSSSEAQPPVRMPEPAQGPEDDPCELFEPTAAGFPPLPPVREPGAAAPVPPAAQIDTSSPAHDDHGGASCEDGVQRDQQAEENPPAPTASGQVENLGDVSSVKTPANTAPPSSSSPAATRSPLFPQSPLRSGPVDPLAPLRALSDEEMIALFT
ncbi:MAG: hypothetical protein ACRECE_09345, partial [Xanthobacteraceae bacterium]